jgi:predicted RNA-binding protein YlqC (UPF0109 family)
MQLIFVKTLVPHSSFTYDWSMNIKMNSKDFVSEITEHLTGEKPTVEVVEDKDGAVLTVTPRGNVSALIGRQGTTIDAIRTVCKAIGFNGKHRIKLKLNEQDRHSHRD